MADLGGILFFDSDINAGTGNYNSFLRIQNTGEEEGFNTNTNGQLDNKDGIWTHNLLISSLAVVTIGTTDYYEIRLDLNEVNSKEGQQISLDQLQLFYGAAATTSLAGLTEFYNLQDDYGSSVPLDDLHSGSGSDDYYFLIPTSLVLDKSGYLTLYADFSGADGGFEEFRVKSLDVGDGLPLINLVKDASVTSIDEGTPTDITYTYTLTNTSPGPDALTLTSFIDDFGTPGDDTDDIDLLTGASGTDLGDYYVSGDDNGDGKLDKTETWTFQFTREDAVINATDDPLHNIAGVNAVDEEGNNASDSDDATVTINDLDPTINIDKVASVTQVQAGQDTSVTFTYTLTNTSLASTDPLVITHLVDDMGTVDTGDDVILFDGDSTIGKGIYYDSGDDGDGLLESGESWVYKFTTTVNLDLGETRTNIVTVDGHDDEDNPVTDTDDASITSYNLGRTPGFWANNKNGGLLWDGYDNTFPKGGTLGTTSFLGANKDLLYTVHDLNGDGDAADTVNGISEATGSRQYLMIGDWDHDGYVDSGENVLVMTRTQALSFLNASEKQQQDGRWMVARDLVASWLNFLGGSYVGAPGDKDSPRHYMDEAIAWLLQTSANHDHVLSAADDFTALTKVGTSTTEWNTGFDFNGTSGVQNDVPATGDVLGLDATPDLDILGGGQIHTGLDHYNNFGFVI